MEITNFNDNWRFKLETDKDWKEITLPHDWLISDTNNLYKDGIGTYKKNFTLDEKTEDLLKTKTYYIYFDGVYMDSAVYINGKEAGQWKNGYTSFYFDITSFLKKGENEITVTVNHKSPNTRWYSGAGIYRDCYLITKNKTHFAIDGIYTKTYKLDDNNWKLVINSEIILDNKEDFGIFHLIKGLVESSEFFKINSKGEYYVKVRNPKLWDIENPFCYELESFIIDLQKNEIVDSVKTRFGFRNIEFTTNDGFFLNGRRVIINGVCQHHDLGALGAAINKDALRRQLTILRTMGVNAIRTSHNPPAPCFMELTDEMGFLVMSEFTDMWKREKTKYDYSNFFMDWAERDVASWIRRDRNCPSIIMWSIGNEISDTHADSKDGSETIKWLMGFVKQHDPKQHAQITLCSNYMPWKNTQKCMKIVKLAGYNYGEYLYEEHRKKYPDWIIYGSETASHVQSRGIYHFPLKREILSDDDLQCSDLGNSTTSWGAKNAEYCVLIHNNTHFVLGHFIWTGTDYIGEPTPYHTKNSYFGQIDTAGFPKDSYYIYKAGWTDYKKEPFVHVFPYWDFSLNQQIDVRITSNCPKVELFLNGKSLGKKTIDKINNLIADYSVKYEPGFIKAIAYDENDKEIAECIRNSFGDAVFLKLTHTQFGELIFTEITALDADGNTVDNANNFVIVKVLNGELLGLDNGDSTDYDQYQNTNRRKLFSGKLLAIVKPFNPNNPQETKISAEIDWSEIPIRKIELTQNGYEIKSNIFPKNATYKDIEWRLANEAGIDSYLGTLETVPGENNDNTKAILHPKGDGEVYIRCCAKNGKDHINIISLLPITISGFGVPFLDPYSFVSGGLYTKSNAPMGNGNEKGVATLRDGISHVGFTDLDFGEFGSDEITIWLFPMENNFPLEIWLGMPEENGRKLTTVFYDKGSVWNTYIPATYKLPERIKGIQTISFVLKQKVHIKGFQFTSISKCFEELYFTENNNIYGDSFSINENKIEKIGNNVTISFNNMNFEKQAARIRVFWRSMQDSNTIKLVFNSIEGNEIVNMLTLLKQDNYDSIELKLENPLLGKGNLNFIFLPGSNIDLEKFQFLD